MDQFSETEEKAQKMSTLDSKTTLNQKMTVKDPIGLFWILLSLLGLILLTLWLAAKSEWILALISSGLIALAFMMLRAENEGYVIDLNGDSFTYPGGKVADEITDYITPSWWAQRIGLQRGEIKLSSITSISRVENEIWSDSSKQYITIYGIKIHGTFGSIENTFSSSGKRDQLYSLLGQTLGMGTAVVLR